MIPDLDTSAPDASRAAAIADPVLTPDAAALERHAARRARFLDGLGGGVAVLPAARIQHRSRDTEIRFRQDSDFFYLTGFNEPDAVAVLTPHDAERRFTLFVRPRDPEREAWDGVRAGVDGAREVYGADSAYPVDELDEHLHTLLEPADRIHYALGADAELDRRITALVARFRRGRQRLGRGPVALEDPGAALGEMRLIKEPAELDRLRAAARINVDGHREAMRAARPGIAEWELEAHLESAWRVRGAGGPAYPSIVASGANATILHYTTNDRRTEDGDLVLIDAGCESGLYCSDITRTFPVSGRFTDAQRAVYEVVLAAEDAAIAAAVPGAPFTAIHEAALSVLVRGMLTLGLLRGDAEEIVEKGEHKRFFLHQTSHWLGLDVHDVGLYARAGEAVMLAEGMVLTVEPGIYVPTDAEDVPAEYRGIGIRIEDNLIVTAAGPEVLTRGVPVHVDEIEALVGGAGPVAPA
jgi:Xaa-Pro aminopeptidase